MRKIYFIVALLASANLFGQQLGNPGFELWENAGTVADEPTDWSSIKTADALGSAAPQVWWQSTDAHSGTYSVKLQNVTSFFIVATGTLTNGRVHADMNPENGYVFTDPAVSGWNTAFTARPDSLVGWYKYTSQSGDHGKAEVILHTGAGQNPENGTAGNFVAKARFETPASNVNSWTRFSVPFNYFQSGNPEYALAVLTSGDSTVAKDGSIAYFDDIEFIYNPTGVSEDELINQTNVFADGGLIYVNASEKIVGADVTVFDISGRQILKQKLTSPVSSFTLNNTPGVYLCEIRSGTHRTVKKVVLR